MSCTQVSESSAGEVSGMKSTYYSFRELDGPSLQILSVMKSGCDLRNHTEHILTCPKPQKMPSLFLSDPFCSRCS